MSLQTNARYLLALHSSTEKFGVAALDLTDSKKEIRSSVFNVGQKLSNNLFDYVEELLSKKDWWKIARLAVTTGPGSFTGTRLSIAMARTLAQQLNCPLDGISSFSLMAPRLCKTLSSTEREKPFWIIKSLKRRGIIAGKYQIVNYERIKIIEIKKPHLLNEGDSVKPALNATEDVSSDIQELMNNCLDSYKLNKKSLWQDILPIYPISPVGKVS